MYTLSVIAAIIAGLLVCFLAFPMFMLKIFMRTMQFLHLLDLRISGRENIPAHGPAVIVANHISFIDALWIAMCTSRKVHFLVHQDFFQFPPLRCFLRAAGAISVPPAMRTKAMSAFQSDIRRRLSCGELICFFPEGGVSDSGTISQFKSGIAGMIPENADNIKLIPVRLGALWGRLFSLDHGRIRFHAPRRIPIPVSISIGNGVAPDTPPFKLRQMISELGAEAEMRPFPGELPLHTTFAIHAKQHPFKPPFKDFEGRKMRYFQLLTGAVIFSKLIKKLDEERGGRASERGGRAGFTGIFLPNCAAEAMTILGVMFAGRAPAMLNYTSGRETVKLAVKKADCKLILTSRKFLAKLNFEALENMVFLEDLLPLVTWRKKLAAVLQVLFLPSKMLARRLSPQTWDDVSATAVLLFSSGSSGVPKAVELSHHSITADIYSFWRLLNWHPGDRIVGNLPLFHAFGFTVCFAFPAISGTTTVYTANPLEAEKICRLVRQEKITLMITTPTFLQNYMRKYSEHDFDSLRLVVTGAEKLRRDIADDFFRLTGLEITEGFGCTELSPIMAINLSRSFFDFGLKCGEKGSIGTPLPGIHVKIVSIESGEELPPGESGLMLVKGGLLMKGYLDEPELNAEVLRDGFYNTGDVAKMNEDGYIFITGRLSRFSKIAGEMVPHEMVEHALNESLHSQERLIAVTGKPDARRGEKLVVFYSLRELDIAASLNELRRRKLPNLWIPKEEDFVYIEKIPLLGTGKLDLQQLKKLCGEIK